MSKPMYPSLEGLMEEDETVFKASVDAPPSSSRELPRQQNIPSRSRSSSCDAAGVSWVQSANQASEMAGGPRRYSLQTDSRSKHFEETDAPSPTSPSTKSPEKVQNPAPARKQSHRTCIHDMVKKEKWESLFSILSTSQGDHDVNATDGNGNTPLHIAVAENKSVDCAKVLLAFGAELSHKNHFGQRPDELGSKKNVVVRDFVSKFRLPKQIVSARTVDEADRKASIYTKPGWRILFLDGGGIRGLAEIEMLMEIERITGKKIVDLFDLLVGTSTGGIIALALIYCRMSLSKLKSCYLEMKSKVFAGKLSRAFTIENKTKAMEDILQKMFGAQTLTAQTHPKVMIAAVNKQGREPTLEFFNNFMEEASDPASRKLREAEVRFVARATCAAPLRFLACNNYLDGGILANNPSMKALSEIRRYHLAVGKALPKFSIAVSLGSGTFVGGEMEDRDVDFLGRFFVPEVMKAMRNFFDMLQKALTQSESVARECATMCQAEGIPFFRFSPTFHSFISPGERDDKKILDMLISTRLYCESEEIERQLVRMSRVLNYLDHLKDKYTGRVPL